MNKIIINNKIFQEIPFNEYYLKHYTYKGLVFVQHGFQSNKNRGGDYLAINLARLGFFVIAVDAFKHGDRIAEPYISGQEYKRYADVFEVVTHTAIDILSIYQSRYAKKYKVFDFIGVSMGGLIAYQVAMQTDKIRKLVPVISSPKFLELAKATVNVGSMEKYQKIINNNIEYIKSIDPINHLDKLNYHQLFILNTTQDNVVLPIFSQTFYEEYQNDKMHFKLYEDIHNVNQVMQEDILSFIAEEKVVL